MAINVTYIGKLDKSYRDGNGKHQITYRNVKSAIDRDAVYAYNDLYHNCLKSESKLFRQVFNITGSKIETLDHLRELEMKMNAIVLDASDELAEGLGINS